MRQGPRSARDGGPGDVEEHDNHYSAAAVCIDSLDYFPIDIRRHTRYIVLQETRSGGARVVRPESHAKGLIPCKTIF